MIKVGSLLCVFALVGEALPFKDAQGAGFVQIHDFLTKTWLVAVLGLATQARGTWNDDWHIPEFTDVIVPLAQVSADSSAVGVRARDLHADPATPASAAYWLMFGSASHASIFPNTEADAQELALLSLEDEIIFVDSFHPSLADRRTVSFTLDAAPTSSRVFASSSAAAASPDGQPVGILGARMNSAFANAFPSFLLLPLTTPWQGNLLVLNPTHADGTYCASLSAMMYVHTIGGQDRNFAVRVTLEPNSSNPLHSADAPSSGPAEDPELEPVDADPPTTANVVPPTTTQESNSDSADTAETAADPPLVSTSSLETDSDTLSMVTQESDAEEEGSFGLMGLLPGGRVWQGIAYVSTIEEADIVPLYIFDEIVAAIGPAGTRRATNGPVQIEDCSPELTATLPAIHITAYDVPNSQLAEGEPTLSLVVYPEDYLRPIGGASDGVQRCELALRPHPSNRAPLVLSRSIVRTITIFFDDVHGRLGFCDPPDVRVAQSEQSV